MNCRGDVRSKWQQNSGHSERILATGPAAIALSRRPATRPDAPGDSRPAISTILGLTGPRLKLRSYADRLITGHAREITALASSERPRCHAVPCCDLRLNADSLRTLPVPRSGTRGAPGDNGMGRLDGRRPLFRCTIHCHPDPIGAPARPSQEPSNACPLPGDRWSRARSFARRRFTLRRSQQDSAAANCCSSLPGRARPCRAVCPQRAPVKRPRIHGLQHHRSNARSRQQPSSAA
jgi:hypothetical protein